MTSVCHAEIIRQIFIEIKIPSRITNRLGPTWDEVCGYDNGVFPYPSRHILTYIGGLSRCPSVTDIIQEWLRKCNCVIARNEETWQSDCFTSFAMTFSR